VAGDTSAPPRQRWRLVLARSADAPRTAGRELIDAWEAAIETTGLPLHRPAGRARSRVAFGAPLPFGIAAEHELADLFLAERVPAWRMREALAGPLPEGWSVVDLFDVWVGSPPLPGRVVAADYRIELGGAPDPAAVAAAAREMLGARELPRVRQKGDAAVPYDLRPLLADVTVSGAGSGTELRVRTRIHPELGSGRPEEVIAALGEWLGRALEVRAVVRERLILADDTG
jgi:hypothetical protein